MKYLGIKLTKNMQAMYNENYKTLLRKIKEDFNKWKRYGVHGKLSIVKMSILLKLIYSFNTIPIKTQ